MVIFKKFVFDSAHFLPNVPDGHKCKRVHGHTYKLTIFIEGDLQEKLDWVMDFGDLKSVVNPVVDRLDHNFLNDISGLDNPTCERIAQWIWEQIKSQLPGLVKIELYETPTSGVIYTGK
ncbi:MAG: 6-carboxytetrahydropterin synthase QueD [Bacteroidetes bacterium]|nr:6-carboxytetrahydropterin synthase QueD [Bacteroidota bacterium]